MPEASVPKPQKLIFTGEMPPSPDRLHVQTAALGAVLSEGQFDELFEAVNELYEIKQNVYAEEIAAFVDEIGQSVDGRTRLMGLQITLGKSLVPTATVTLKMPDGRQEMTEASGSSSTDAIFSAIQQAMRIRVFLSDFNYGTITQGVNALGKAQVTVEHHGQHVTARAYSVDMLDAAAKAFLIALNIIDQSRKEQFRS